MAFLGRLCAEGRLPELEKHTIDFPDVVLFAFDEEFDNQVARIGGRKRESRACEQVGRFVEIQVQGDGECECSLLGGLVIHVAADLGKMLAVKIRLLVDIDIVQVLFMNQVEKLVAESFARFRKNVVEGFGA